VLVLLVTSVSSTVERTEENCIYKACKSDSIMSSSASVNTRRLIHESQLHLLEITIATIHLQQ